MTAAVTVENIHGVRFLKVNGITRAIYMPRIGWKSRLYYQHGILVIGFFGWCFVLAPLAPTEVR